MKQPGEMGLLMIRSQSEPWEMLISEAKRGNYRGESSPTAKEGADFVSWCNFAPLATQY